MRNFSLDLLKIVAMLMVVILHIVWRGGVLEAASGSNVFTFFSVRILHVTCLCAVNCFILATGAVMYSKSLNVKRIFNYWVCVVFYSFCITLFAALFVPRVDIGLKEWINVFLPIGRNQYWFFTNYVALFFTIPLLNHIIASLERVKLSKVLIGGFIMLSLYPSVMGLDLFVLRNGYSYLWFMYLYLCSAYIGKYPQAFNWSITKSVLIFCSVAIGSLLWYMSLKYVGNILGVGHALSGNYLNYNSPGIFIEAICLLVLFRNIKIEKKWMQAIIAFFSSSVFYVYILHDNMIFKEIVQWENRFAWIGQKNFISAASVIFMYAIVVFVSCVIIDKTRVSLLRLFNEIVHKK